MNGRVRSSTMFMKRNASTILTCVGGAGVVATSVMAVKATPKAMRLLEEAQAEKGEDLTKLEKVKVAGPAYVPAIIVGASTLACVFGANVLNQRKQAALMSAYALLDSSYKDYRKKVEALYGEGADKNVRTELAKDKYDENDISVNDGKQLFYDEYSERYFETTMEDVIKAQYEINRKIAMWGGATLNDFYEFVGLPTVDYGDYIGWSYGTLFEMCWEPWLDFYHEKVELDDGLECFIIRYSTEPMYDYEYY